MKVDVKCVHFDMTQNVKDYLDKKIKRLGYAEDLIVDLMFTFTRDTKEYKLESNIHFRWGRSSHVGVDSFNITKGIDILLDKLDNKINKEKEKIQEH